MNLKDKIPKTVKVKSFVATLLLVCIVSALVTSYYASSSAYPGNVSEVWFSPPFSEASYVIGQYNSTYYYGKNCTTGKYDYLSTNASYVINSAINALTLGRDHFETVSLTGEITITNAILLKSYTRIVIGGELKASGSGFNMIQFATTDQYLVEICGGGIINGNSAADYGIYLEQASSQPSWRSMVHDLTIEHCVISGLRTKTACRVIASNMYVYHCDSHGVWIDSYDCKLANIVVGACGNIGAMTGYGFFIDSTNEHLTGCKAYGSGSDGFYINGARSGLANCIAQENSRHGYTIDQRNVGLVGCHSDRNSLNASGTYSGFNIVGDKVTLTGCKAYNFDSGGELHGINIASTASEVYIDGFTVDALEAGGQAINIVSGASDIQCHGIPGEYQVDTSSWSDPTTTDCDNFEGRIVYQYNAATSPYFRICIYAGGAWKFMNAS